MQLGFRSTFIECQFLQNSQPRRSHSVPAGFDSDGIDLFMPERQYVCALWGKAEELRESLQSQHETLPAKPCRQRSHARPSSPKKRGQNTNPASDTSTCERTSCNSSVKADSFSGENSSSDEAMSPKHAPTSPGAGQWKMRRPREVEWYDEDLVKTEDERGVIRHSSWYDETVTTIMVCNIPCSTRQDEFASTVDSMGFAGRYDFLNLPCHHKADSNLGYAFINFPCPEDAALCTRRFTDFRFPNTRSTKVCSVKPARIQGGEANASQLLRSKKGKASPSKAPYSRSWRW